MKSRIVFYCAALLALVLFLAATSSHATERRDPVVTPDQKQSAPTRATDQVIPARSRHAKKSASTSAKPQNRARAVQKKNPESSVGTAGYGK